MNSSAVIEAIEAGRLDSRSGSVDEDADQHDNANEEAGRRDNVDLGPLITGPDGATWPTDVEVEGAASVERIAIGPRRERWTIVFEVRWLGNEEGELRVDVLGRSALGTTVAHERGFESAVSPGARRAVHVRLEDIENIARFELLVWGKAY